MDTSLDSRWTLMWVKLGALCWLLHAALYFAGYAPFGLIELWFLLAPLVVVPLGFELLDGYAQGMRPPLGRALRVMQPVAALMAAASFWFPAGRLAGALSSGWIWVGAVAAWMALVDLTDGGWRSLERVVFAMARFDLALAAGWLLASRLGVTPMGFQEPIVLLTAMHFHFSGFATALIAGVTLHHWGERKGTRYGMVRWMVALIVFVPYLLAAGFVFSALLKLVCALILAATLLGFAALQISAAADFRSGVARALLRTAAGLLVAGMALVIVYATGDYTQKYWLIIPFMARIHGPLNGPGFVLLSLVGWVAEKSYRAQRFQDLVHEIDRKSVRISGLRRMSS
ncbi:MAG: YndJ family protein [Acidobacteriia bacterium]|nr:YndJ family protein [Terriglobia bacterium]